MKNRLTAAGRSSPPSQLHDTEHKGSPVPTSGSEPSAPGSEHFYPQGFGPREIHIVAPPQRFRRFGNAAAMGLVTFGIGQMQKSMLDAGINVGYGHGVRSLTGQFLSVAGIAQMLAGLWQIANGDTFEGATFMSFGSRWLARGFAQIPGTGVIDFQNSESPDIRRKQNGIEALPWCIWVFMVLLGNIKSHLLNQFMFLTLNLEVDFGCAGAWTGNKRITIASGWFGFFCGMSAIYNAASIILNEENFWFSLPVGHWYTPYAAADEEASA
ncbi:hypothetical protein LPJ61_004075 [Coemansia biformis]|uniref:Uncharacterized protein n=1 Tax=Coemansia biformis TaxID=1286918 RepID=A0A9W8CV17_9FUNG|nr:hypothetical protein LPJ61_004075 [Coemansia biformis]